MRTRTLLGLGLVTLALAASALHCGGSTSTTGSPGTGGDGGGTPPPGTPPPGSGPPPIDLGPPVDHRATANACSTSRPPGLQGDAGAGGFPGSCGNDSQCTMGTNGRCEPSGHNAGPLCSYDDCFADSDCGTGKVCECGKTINTTTGERFGNACLPGNCRVDTDCGAGGYCSPTYDTSCGPYNGIVGYYCHTPSDDCTKDAQCAEGGAGYCAYDPMKSHWVCEYGICAG